MNQLFVKALKSPNPSELDIDEWLRESEKIFIENKVRAIFLFGSMAKKKSEEGSDIDLFIIAETEIDFIERPINYLSILENKYEINILVYTPEEFRELTRKPTFGFWQDVVSSMKLIYGTWQ